MIYVYICYFEPLTRPISVTGKSVNHLPGEVINRAGRFLKSDDQQCHLLGRVLLKIALSELKLPYTIGQILLTAYGRPYFSNDIDFNISHSGTFVVCGISTVGKIGIDVECVKPIDVSDFRSSFLPFEWEAINRSGDNRLFYKYWTMKEAAIKADGRGLSVPLSDVSIQNDKTVRIGEALWSISQIDTPNAEYFCHLASTTSNPVMTIKRIPVEALAHLLE